MPSRVLREHVPLDPDPSAISELHLARLRLTADEYATKVAAACEARTEYEAKCKDPSLTPQQRHHVEASFHVNFGRAYLKVWRAQSLPT
jgi:hypothetical protein